MEFTQAEAAAKVLRRQWVQTRDTSFEEPYGIPAGTWGRVLSTHRTGRMTLKGITEVWGVNICFYPASVVVRNLSKELYERALVEM
jgi:hypothetical protein